MAALQVTRLSLLPVLHFLPEIVSYFVSEPFALEIAVAEAAPEQHISAKDLREIVVEAPVIRTALLELLGFRSFFAPLNGGVLVCQQVHVEAEEPGDGEAEGGRQDPSGEDEVGDADRHLLAGDHRNEDGVRCYDDEERGQRCVEEHVEEVFLVVEADAVGDPGAMMIHFENASVALAAVVSSVRLRYQTSLAQPDASVLFLLNRHYRILIHIFLGLPLLFFEQRRGFRHVLVFIGVELALA